MGFYTVEKLYALCIHEVSLRYISEILLCRSLYILYQCTAATLKDFSTERLKLVLDF
jgi:hypothetical protein